MAPLIDLRYCTPPPRVFAHILKFQNKMADSKSDDGNLSIYFDDKEMSVDEENFLLPRENLIWIFSWKSTELFKKVLKMLSLGIQMDEAKLALGILHFVQNQSEANKKSIKIFLKEMSVTFGNCYEKVEGIKCPKQKAI